MTRDAIMTNVIEEIKHLRENMTQMSSMLRNAQQMLETQKTSQSLHDPYNRGSYSVEDLERAFQVMYLHQIGRNQNMGRTNTTDEVMLGFKALYDVTQQIGKPEHKLAVVVMEENVYSIIRFNLKDLSRVLDSNWTWYQDYMQNRKQGIFMMNADIGAWVLTDLCMKHYASGNLSGYEATLDNILKFTQRCKHAGTCQYVLSAQIAPNRGSVSLPLAKKISKLLDGTFWSPIGTIIEGTSMINDNKIKKGVDLMERGLTELLAFGKGNDSIHLFIVYGILSAYVTARCVDKGITLANYALEMFDKNHIVSFLGKPQIIRLKANLVIMKQYPDFQPEPQTWTNADAYVQQVITLCESITKPTSQKPSQGPLPLLAFLVPSHAIPDEDPEELLMSSLEQAGIEGLVIVELHCTVDLIRYFLHIGDISKAAKMVLVLKDVMSRMTGSHETGELHRAIFVASLVDLAFEGPLTSIVLQPGVLNFPQ